MTLKAMYEGLVRARATYAREYKKPGRGAWPHDNNTVHIYIRVRMRVNMRSRAGGRGHMIIILYMSIYGYVCA